MAQTLLEKWRNSAYSEEQDQKKLQELWNDYFEKEKGIYEKLLKNPDDVVTGTVAELAKKYKVSQMIMTCFLDGINDSLKNPNPIETMEADTEVNLGFDKELLYKNMVAAGADWLYKLPQWDAIFSEEKQKELRQELEGLKGYEFVHGVKDDSIPIVSNHPFREVLEVLFPTKSGTARVYAKTKGEKLLDVMIYGHTPYMDVLKHRAYDISKDVLEKYVACLPAMREAANAQREEAIKARQKADQEDMHNIFMALQAAEDGDCLIVIGGKESLDRKSVV
mgnify:CR=1 FL=1